MKTAAVLLYLSFAAALFASGVSATSMLWPVLVWAVVVLFVAAILRVHAVVNRPGVNR
ncbi:hypothetical protein [Curtobacterium sp. MCSS17_011]|uniref:hypothetical protein n=1 Tax=Curtobacterium sp. MCSS17_011 TaxID=2175643 RepID=UPI0015E8C95E|nr:hypothetical protein [Curtobacterium sp. MCSS17_011]